ncbi:MAG: efflux RND transporter permease subunit [Calditrichae bacterium]|nr:efflux RND transporter permease subunit [Calditrichota bacterium]MCB9058947.1 efflux RND transporter permease subunit [Calditrichia bacterium]
MKSVIEYFIRYPIWTNVLLGSVILFGLIQLNNMKYAFFPEVPPSSLTIQVVYPGASPEEVEEGVILKIEENIDGIEGVERVTSVSRENFGTVTVEATKDADMDKVTQDVKNAVDRINSFPQDSEKPVIFEQKFRTRAISVIIFGETDLYNLKYIAENMRDELLATEEISQVAIQGLPELEMSIELSEKDMRRYNIRFDEIVQAVAAGNVNISGGKFETADEEILIRSYGKNYFASDMLDLVVRTNPDGSLIRLADVANVKEKWEDIPDKTFYNDRAALVLDIDKTAEEDIIAVADKTKEIVKKFNDSNNQVQALVLDDRTDPLRQRLQLLVNNGILGLLFVLIALGFFLNLRISFWVSVGIPFSFGGMFILAGLMGITINVISLFGMIVVIGILVDDAIVVSENIFAHYERGKPALRAAIDGSIEVLGPVFTSVTTTMVAFLPFFFLDGFLGKFIWHMALIVVATLFFSLVEAFLILPSHLAHSRGLHPHKDDSKIRKRFEEWIHHLTYDLYAPTLKLAMRHKWTTMAVPLFGVLLTIGLVGGGFIGATFFPFIDGDQLPVNITLVSGKQESETNATLKMIEEKAWELNEILKSERADSLDVVIGMRRELGTNDFLESGSNSGKLTIQLIDGEIRNMDSYIIANRLREMVGPIPKAEKITYGRISFFGKPVSVSLLGNDLQDLNHARDLLMAELESFSTLRDVSDTNQEGRRELDIHLKPRAHALGLTLRDVAGQVRQGFFGQEIQRIQRGEDEIRVWVRYRDEDRAALGFLDNMRIRTPQGGEYPFSELATYKIERGITAINHLDRKREVRVEASLANEDIDLPPILEEVQEKIVPAILKQTPGVLASFGGQSRDQKKTQNSMRQAFPLALLLMFILVVLVFRSYSQAIVIFGLIPLGVVGAFLGHGLQGIQINTLSVYGIIALSGIIINDSIVLTDQFNRNLREGQKVYDAIYNAGISRLRPILLTSLTTAAGLAPLILEKSRQAQFLIPMAVSVAYGLIFGTVILLFVLPAALLILNRIRSGWSRYINKENKSAEEVEPAIKELIANGEKPEIVEA